MKYRYAPRAGDIVRINGKENPCGNIYLILFADKHPGTPFWKMDVLGPGCSTLQVFNISVRNISCVQKRSM